jgi:RNA polymerase sigma factor (sigma-70 family)
MVAKGTGKAMRNLGLLLREGTVAGYPDGQLLEQFLARRGESAEAAFAALVERHGPMVLGVCRRALPDPRDAEDAFQATFLILARKARAIRVDDSLGRWLYGVSRRVASRARASAGRRLDRERELATMGGPPAAEPPADPLELREVLDEELGRLPAKYRDPIVLCYLQDQTHEGAAQQLGWPVGTVRGRLARARDLLRTRLVRRGLAPAVALLGTTAEARATVPSLLADVTTKAACRASAGVGLAGLVSARVAERVGWELASMSVGHWKGVAGVLFAVGAVCVGAALGAGSPPDAPQRPDPGPKASTRDDRGEIVGSWASEEPIQETVRGVPKPPRLVKTRWEITSDKITLADEDGFLEQEIRYTLDPTKTPKAIDLRYPASGMVLAGAYRLDGDELTLVYGVARPKELKEGAGLIFHKLRREDRSPRLLSPRYELAPGCQWAMAPGGAIPSSMGGGAIQVMVEKRTDGSLVIILASMKRTGPEPGPDVRPVVFDARGKRHLPKPEGGGAGATLAVPDAMLSQQKYRLDPADLPAEKAATLGIEAVPSDVRRAAREAASVEAIGKARTRGIDLLPWPKVGEPYDFTLKAADGRVLRSRDLKGKVVLIDCWATWCSPCMAKMPKLKELYEKRHGDGFEVIGVNFDHDPDHARRALETLDLPWAEVFVPADEPTREIWESAAGIESIPRLLVIDRDGILRYDGGPGDMEDQVGRWLQAPGAKQ